MSEKPVQVGIVGVGWWSDVLATCIKDSSKIAITAVYSRSKDKRNAFADRFGCRPVDTAGELMAMADLDGIIVTTPNNAHLEVVTAAAAAGKHVFVEKPIANTLADADAIGDICRRARVLLSVGHSYRRHAGLRHIKGLIEAGDLGRISLANAVFSKDHGLRLKADGSWRSSADEVPGGCLMQIGIHQIDNLLYLLGDVVDVSAMIDRLETAADIPDLATVLLRFASGAVGFVAADYISADQFALTIYGTKAAARFDLRGGVDILPRAESQWRPAGVQANDYLKAMLEEFADCIRQGTRPECGAVEAIKPLRIIHAAIRSSQERRVVALEEVASPASASQDV